MFISIVFVQNGRSRAIDIIYSLNNLPKLLKFMSSYFNNVNKTLIIMTVNIILAVIMILMTV